MINRTYKLLALLLCLLSSAAIAQEIPSRYLGLEAGLTLIGSSIQSTDYIRADVPYYPMDMQSYNLKSTSYRSYFGIKPEIFPLNDRLGIECGLRYSYMYSAVSKDNYWTSGSNYFYVLSKQDGLNTEYLRVNRIIQNSHYIGIPLEVRYFPTDQHFFRLYVKLGAEVDMRIHTSTDVRFVDDAMESYQDRISNMVGEPDNFSSSAYASVGFRIGKPGYHLFNVEMSLPVVFLNEESSRLVTPRSGGGFQLQYQIPFKPKTK